MFFRDYPAPLWVFLNEIIIPLDSGHLFRCHPKKWPASRRNQWPLCVGMGGRLPSECPAGFVRNTQVPDSSLYKRLLDLGICAYLTKTFRTAKTLCMQIQTGIKREKKVRTGHCLYKLIRKVVSNGGWCGKYVSKAASETWRLERPHDRWAAFWNAFEEPLAQHRLSKVFKDISEFTEIFNNTINKLLPNELGKGVSENGRYAITIKEYNITIIVVININELDSNRIIINVITILPSTHIDTRNIIDLFVY